MIFKNRTHAGQLLAEKLLKYKNADTVVLALPRGGVPVAVEVGRELGVKPQVLAVRKIGLPYQPELGLGAICEDDEPYLSSAMLAQFNLETIDLKGVIDNEKREIQRQVKKFRNGKPLPTLKGKTVIIVDDGLATGATVNAAVNYVKKNGASKTVVAIPVAAMSSAESLRGQVDEVVAVEERADMFAVGQWYEDFSQVSDDEVITLLADSPKNDPETSSRTVRIAEGNVELQGELTTFLNMKAMIVFAHGSGSGRLSPRNIQVARYLNQKGFGTLLFDLLTEVESENRKNVFDIPLLGSRLVMATRWLLAQPEIQNLPMGYFGASTGAGAALVAAAQMGNRVYTVVSRGGRPDLAQSVLDQIKIPVLLIVGEWDDMVIALNRNVQQSLKKSKLVIIPGATHIFEEPGTLDEVAKEAAHWFSEQLPKEATDTLEDAIIKNQFVFRSESDLDELINHLKDKRVVMLGEATHGTSEFYETRAIISKRLIQDHGFKFIAVEGDWPDAYRLNRYIKTGVGRNARHVLKQNHRWPTWMWANEEIVELAEWMRGKNAGFYGLDVYSLFESIHETISYLQQNKPLLVQEIKRRYACFEPFQKDEIAYARSLIQFPPGCEEEVLQNLQKLLQLKLSETEKDGEELFSAQQNAHVAADAEAYYRAMLEGDASSWNIRDSHMMETLDRLLERHGEGAKAIVWAHNTHIGDYRATDMKREGYVNIGGLARQSYGDENVALVGFGTYHGSVLAGHAWDAPEEVMELPNAKAGSFEDVFHQAAEKSHNKQFYLVFKNDMPGRGFFSHTRGHRAVGVVYNALHEGRSNYVPTELAERYDAFIFIDQTHALRSLHAKFKLGEIPETWPQGQ